MRVLRQVLLAGLVLAGGTAAAKSGALNAQLAEVHAAVEKYRDHSVARREGWKRRTGHVPLMGEHWALPRGPDYVTGAPLDFSRPSNLMYAQVGDRMELVAVAYVVRISAFEPLPEGFAGAHDRWHVHNTDQILEALRGVRPLIAGLGRSFVDRRMRDGRRRLAMVHVWLDGRNPDGVFANLNPTLPYRRLGLAGRYSRGASLNAAMGVALAHRHGCDNALKGKLWIAGVDGHRKRALMRRCGGHARTVRANLSQPPQTLNAVAAQVWRDVESELQAVLTDGERTRIASIVEQGCSVQ